MTDEIIVPDYIEPITAYRCWQVYHNKLISLTAGLWTWQPGKNTAQCHFWRQDIPHQNGCHCGLYSKNSRAGMWLYRRAISKFDYPIVMGEIKIWGKVIPGDKGYRSQYAEITALYATRRDRDRINRIAEIYGVPVKKLHWWQLLPRHLSFWTYYWTLWLVMNGVNIVSIFYNPRLLPSWIPAFTITAFAVFYALAVMYRIIGIRRRRRKKE